jgi:hypothetical protein
LNLQQTGSSQDTLGSSKHVFGVHTSIRNTQVATSQSGMGTFEPLDQDDFWLNQPKIMNLIAFKVLEQLYGFA